jgi:TonB family protein
VPWPAADGALRVGGRIVAPTLTKKVNPVYPKAALAERITGLVILEAVIGVDGKVTDTRVLRSVPLLDKAAVDAVQQWEYTPTTLDGKPIRIVMTVTVTFNVEPPPGAAPYQATGPLTVAPWPAADGALRIGGNIAPPRKTKDARPVYPVAAQADRLSGAVILEVLIGADGKVKDVRVLRSSPVFDKSAVDAVKKWEYERTLVNGVPVAIVMPVTVTFTLR